MAGRNVSLAIAVALLGLLGLAPGAQAQEPRIERSPALDCLSPPAAERGAPEFPFELWKLEKTGRVKVALDFTGPAQRPAVEVLDHVGDEAFVDAVKDHVRTLRVPCLTAADTPTRLVIDFVFQPDSRRAQYIEPVDAADSGRARTLECLKHITGDRAPDYPSEAQRRDVQGRVLLYMHFASADLPPTIEAYTAPGNGLLKTDIEYWARGYRLPCHQGGPVTATIIFEYR